MNTRFATLAIGILAVGGMRAEPLGKIAFGTPHRRVFPATEGIPRWVCIELPVTISNTSTEAIRFGMNPGPQFTEYVRRKTTSKHWSDITPRGMCGVGYSVRELAPGASIESTVMIPAEYGGHGYRLELPILQGYSRQVSNARIRSPVIVLPKVEG